MDIQAHLDEVEQPAPTLLICPMSLVGNWQREAERFAPDNAYWFSGSSGCRTDIESMGDYDRADDLQTLAQGRHLGGRRVPDRVGRGAEHQDPSAAKHKPVRSIENVGAWRWPGAGENHLTGLWSIVLPRSDLLLCSATTRRPTPIERHGDRDASEMLRQLTGPFILRRRRAIGASSKSSLKMEQPLQPDQDQASLYKPSWTT